MTYASRSLLLVTCAAVAGCASMNSTMAPGATSGGLLYYMPKRDIVITVTNANGKVTSITATPSSWSAGPLR
jgi:hypothetical protein